MKYTIAFAAFLAAMVAIPTILYMLSVSNQKMSMTKVAIPPISRTLTEFAANFYPELPKGYKFATKTGSHQTAQRDKQPGPIDLTVELKAEWFSAREARVPILERIQIRAFLPNSILTGDCEHVVECKHTFSIPQDVSLVCLDAEVQIEGSTYQSSKTCDSSFVFNYKSTE